MSKKFKPTTNSSKIEDFFKPKVEDTSMNEEGASLDAYEGKDEIRMDSTNVNPSSKVRKDILHDHNAERFMALKDTLDLLGREKVKAHLKEKIKKWREEGKDYTTRSGVTHFCAKRPFSATKRNENRKNVVPKSWTQGKEIKAPISWIVCYVNDILPNMYEKGWERFDCSHLCIEDGVPDDYSCMDKDCLIWESKSINQSRGNPFCLKKCSHCANRLCYCQSLHNPPCK